MQMKILASQIKQRFYSQLWKTLQVPLKTHHQFA